MHVFVWSILGGSAQNTPKYEIAWLALKSGQTISTKWSDGGAKVLMKKIGPFMV